MEEFVYLKSSKRTDRILNYFEFILKRIKSFKCMYEEIVWHLGSIWNEILTTEIFIGRNDYEGLLAIFCFNLS